MKRVIKTTNSNKYIKKNKKKIHGEISRHIFRMKNL